MSEPVTRFIVGRREGGCRLDQYLHQKIPGLSRSKIQKAIRERVTLSWVEKVRASTPVRPGGVIDIGYRQLHEEPLDLTIPILQRGEGWIAVDKPPSIPVHPVNRYKENTLIRMLRRQEGDEELRLAHRLDRETSGVLLIATGAESASLLSTAFLRSEVRKEYLAWVRGAVEADHGTIDLPVGQAEGSKIFVKQAGVPGGKPAVTRWKVERRAESETLLRLHPESGRRHQLRVHLDSIGHPIVGDLLYGRPEADYLTLVAEGRDVRSDGPGPARQLLHSTLLVFPDPQSPDRNAPREISVEAPLPKDFDR